MRIGIYGGSFNPIHKGHTELAASIVQQGLVDELWLLVSPLNPLKQGETSDIAEYEHRLSMARLATEDIEGVKVSDFEKNLPLPSYTITTLGELHKAYPEHEFVLVIGAEGKGLGRLVKQKCDDIVSLPMHGGVNSLNASNAGAILMYEVVRQRHLFAD